VAGARLQYTAAQAALPLLHDIGWLDEEGRK